MVTLYIAAAALICFVLFIAWVTYIKPAKVDRYNSEKPRSSVKRRWPKQQPPMPTPGRNQRRKKTNLLHVSKATRRKHRTP